MPLKSILDFLSHFRPTFYLFRGVGGVRQDTESTTTTPSATHSPQPNTITNANTHHGGGWLKWGLSVQWLVVVLGGGC